MSERMCPNESCERYHQPTKLMGGCDCGTPLVRFKTEDQEVNDALWNLMSPAAKRLVTLALVARIHDKNAVESPPTNPEHDLTGPSSERKTTC